MQSLFLQGMGSLKLGPDTGTQGWSQSGGTICSKGLPPSRSHAISAGHPFISPKPDERNNCLHSTDERPEVVKQLAQVNSHS